MKNCGMLVGIVSLFLGSWAGARDGQPLPRDFAVTLKPGKAHEECVSLIEGAEVAYRFKASQPVPFNIHFHLGAGPKDPVSYPVKADATTEREEIFRAPVDQHYCWMWSNKSSGDVSLSGSLAIR